MKYRSDIDHTIKENAKELFYKHGPKHVSMDDIAGCSHISKKTLYKLFHNKNDLLQKVVQDLIAKHQEHLEMYRSTAKNAVEEVLKQNAGLNLVCNSIRPSFFYELEVFFPDIWGELELYKLKIHNGIKANLLRGKEEGLYRKDLNTQFIADIRMEQLANVLRPDVTSEITVLYLRSIITEKGKNLLDKYLNNESGHTRLTAENKTNNSK
jgi:AcrR family transcriptional regulator